jgi:CubicO group peptidase (beta-lactamase class C family)
MRIKSLLTIIISLGFAIVSLAQPSVTILTQKVDSLLDEAYAMGLFTGHVAISHHGEPFYYKALGYADWQSERPIHRNTLFNIASLNKQFTEEMIHQLVGEGKLSYSDHLGRYLEGFPEEIGSKVTIQQLLDMSSGMGDYFRIPAFGDLETKDFSLNELVALIVSEPLLFEPGTDEAYSNSGYAVLGAVIEKITGITYQKNLSLRILDPLGIENIYYTKAEKEGQKDRAFGTQIDFEGGKMSMDRLTNATPAGGSYANIDALLTLAEAKMTSTLPSGKTYGKGMFAGGTPFWNSVISYDGESGFSFVVMANTGNISDELAPRISSIIKGEDYPPLDIPFERSLYNIINEKGYGYVKANVGDFAAQQGLPYDSRFLNFFGYNFLFGDRADIAIGLFKINVDLFPSDPNTYDSLAEAYMQTGDRTNALKYYKVAVEMNPDNDMARKTIAELEAEE